jgi:chemotaxis protein methyltransferase CheR
MTQIDTQYFNRIQTIARDRWGLHLTDKKRQLVANRLASFLRKSDRFHDVEGYLAHLEHDADEEDQLVFFDILSTNVTSFFRDPHHFEFLEQELYEPINNGTLTLPGRKLRLWSAACSTGPEPYSMAMHALDSLKDPDSWDIKVLASDLSNSAVAAAQEAVYTQDMVSHLDPALVRRHFLKGSGSQQGMLRIAPHVRDRVVVRRLNLMDAWPFKTRMNVIFVRNVMIYFDRETRTKLVNRMAEVMYPGGLLAVGSAETLSGLDVPLSPVRASFYRR